MTLANIFMISSLLIIGGAILLSDFLYNKTIFKFTDDFVVVKEILFGVIVFKSRKLYYSNISEFRRYDLQKDLFKAYFIGSINKEDKFFIKVRKGIFRSVAFTLNDGEYFYHELKNRIKKSKTR